MTSFKTDKSFDNVFFQNGNKKAYSFIQHAGEKTIDSKHLDSIPEPSSVEEGEKAMEALKEYRNNGMSGSNGSNLYMTICIIHTLYTQHRLC